METGRSQIFLLDLRLVHCFRSDYEGWKPVSNGEIKSRHGLFSFRSDYEGWKLIKIYNIAGQTVVLEVTMRDGNLGAHLLWLPLGLF